MSSHRDPDRLINAFLMEGQTELADPVYDAVRATIERKRQRVAIGPWRMPTMNKLVPIGLGAAAVVVALVVGSQLLGPTASGGVGGAPSTEPAATPSPTPVGGTVNYQFDGAPATTEVDAVADGASVSGTAVTTFGGGTHTVRLMCAGDYGDVWAFGGTTEQTTVARRAVPALGRRSSSRTARPSRSQSGSPTRSGREATATAGSHRSISAASILRTSTPWSPVRWCPRLISLPERSEDCCGRPGRGRPPLAFGRG